MGRDKLKRNLQFKPLCRSFGAESCEGEETIHLLHEEMEALFLMDSKELYQADAAKEMGVSRPTFARILKNARQKVTMMLITGANLQIEDEKYDLLVMVPSHKKESIVEAKPNAPYLLVYHIENHKIKNRGLLHNPVFNNNIRPGQVLPQLCSKHQINFFLAESIGEGLKSALLSKGVHTKVQSKITEQSILKYSNALL